MYSDNQNTSFWDLLVQSEEVILVQQSQKVILLYSFISCKKMILFSSIELSQSQTKLDIVLKCHSPAIYTYNILIQMMSETFSEIVSQEI